MSVAFRRENDDEHKEPRFELPLPPGRNLVTGRGLAQIQDRIAGLDRALAAAADDGERAALERDLRYWRTRAATAELAPEPSAGIVSFGSRVRIRLGGTERTLEIVGHDEADPAADRIAFTAPLARALAGAEPGESVDFNGEEEAVAVLAIEPRGETGA